MTTYLVGGAVRDRLLGREPSERDWVVVGATPDELEASGYKRVGKDFPVFLHPETGEEHALARRERKAGHGYHGFKIDAGPEVSLEADLGRRDLTINAMAQAHDGTVIDPYGGREDLAKRRLRHVSPAFVEDPLRILRVARFAARFAPLGFRVAHETRELMVQIAASGELDSLAPERIWQETQRALDEADPARFFDELAACEALAPVFPEIDAIFGGAGVPAARQALAEATQASLDSAQRFAALCHPLDTDDGLARLCSRLPVPRAFADLAQLTATWHEPFVAQALDDSAALWRFLTACDALRRQERFDRLLATLEAVARGHHGDSERPAQLARAALAAALAVDGGTLAREGWRGAALGAELERRRKAAIEALLRQWPCEHRA